MPPLDRPHRLVYLCDWLPPDFGAVGQYSLLFARERAAAGVEVTLAGLSSTADSAAAEGDRLRIVRRRAPHAAGCPPLPFHISTAQRR